MPGLQLTLTSGSSSVPIPQASPTTAQLQAAAAYNQSAQDPLCKIGTGWGYTGVVVTGLTGAPAGATTAWRMTSTGAWATPGSQYAGANATPAQLLASGKRAVTPGDVLHFKYYVLRQTGDTSTYTPWGFHWSSTGTWVSAGPIAGAITAPIGTWTLVELAYTVPAGVGYIVGGIGGAGTVADTLTTGYQDWVNDTLSLIDLGVFDGDSAGWAWTGTARASSSVRTAIPYGTSALAGVDWPAPAPIGTFSATPDIDGALPVRVGADNRVVTITARTYGQTEAGLRQATGQLQRLVGLIKNSRSGQLLATFPNGDQLTFNVLMAQINSPITKTLVTGKQQTVTLTLTCKPYATGTQYTALATTAVNVPFWTGTFAAPPGDAPALGELTVTPSSATQRTVWWGVETADVVATATSAQLYWPATNVSSTGLTLASSQATMATIAGSVSTQVCQGPLQSLDSSSSSTPPPPISVCNVGSFANSPTHSGVYRVIARAKLVALGTGSTGVTRAIGLMWSAQGATSQIQNAYVAVNTNQQWVLVDLGIIDTTSFNTTRWTGVITHKGFGQVAIDSISLIPCQAQGVAQTVVIDNPTAPIAAYSGYDNFATTSALSGRSAATGGSWTSSGDGVDWAVGGGLQAADLAGATRTDTVGRVGVLSTGSANIVVKANIAANAGGVTGAVQTGLIARYVNNSNFLSVGISYSSVTSTFWLTVFKRVAGSTFIAAGPVDTGVAASSLYVACELHVFDDGTFSAYSGTPGSAVKVAAGYDATLDVGGTLASGTFGIWDRIIGTATLSRDIYTFTAVVPPVDAPAPFQSSLVIGAATHTKTDNTSGAITPLANYQGDHALVQQGSTRTTRLAIKTSRNFYGSYDYQPTDTYAVQLKLTPRFAEVPYT